MNNFAQPVTDTRLPFDEAWRMAIAHQIAEASACLDCLKRMHAPENVMEEARIEAPLHVRRLESIATQLAGDRVGEIYAENESENLIERLRRWM